MHKVSNTLENHRMASFITPFPTLYSYPSPRKNKTMPMPCQPLAWASVHWMVQCTLECHCNATGWPSVHWDTTGPPSEYLQSTLEHHWKNLVEQPHTGMPLEKLSWIRPTMGCHWRNSNFCSLHWNTTGGTVTAHTRPTHIVKHAE